jgi:hypothetical protein
MLIGWQTSAGPANTGAASNAHAARILIEFCIASKM